MIKKQFYLKGIVRNQGKGRAGLGVELYRLDKKADDEDEDPIDLEDEMDDGDGEDDKKKKDDEEDDDGYDSSQVAVMRVYETIGEDFFTGSGITAGGFAEELDKLGDIKKLKIHINCLGGDTHTAQAIHSIISDHSAKKTVYIDGIAASAATLVACAGDEVIARYNSNYMIHNPWTIAMGNAHDLREAADVLDKITDPIVAVYQKKVNGKIHEKTIRSLMDAETWMTAEEAKENGFVDKVRGRIKAVASIGNGKIVSAGKIFNLGKYQYKNVPKYPKTKMKIEEPEKAKIITTVTYLDRKEEEEKLKKEESMTIDEIRKQYPDLYSSIRTEAEVAERGRLSALDAMDAPGLEQLIAAAKADGRKPEQIAVEACGILKASTTQLAQANALQRDASAASVTAGEAPTGKVKSGDKKDRVVNLLNAAHANLAAERNKKLLLQQVPSRN